MRDVDRPAIPGFTPRPAQKTAPPGTPGPDGRRHAGFGCDA